MDIGFLLFSTSGRIGRKGFWLGWLLLRVFSIFALLLFAVVTGDYNPLGAYFGLAVLVIAPLVWIYMAVCVWGKRIHDLGKTAWLVPIPVLAPLALFGSGSLIAVAIGLDTAAGAAVNGLSVLVAGGLSIGMLVWVGASRGDNGENSYGSDPRARAREPERPAGAATTDQGWA